MCVALSSTAVSFPCYCMILEVLVGGLLPIEYKFGKEYQIGVVELWNLN